MAAKRKPSVSQGHVRHLLQARHSRQAWKLQSAPPNLGCHHHRGPLAWPRASKSPYCPPHSCWTNGTCSAGHASAKCTCHPTCSRPSRATTRSGSHSSSKHSAKVKGRHAARQARALQQDRQGCGQCTFGQDLAAHMVECLEVITLSRIAKGIMSLPPLSAQGRDACLDTKQDENRAMVCVGAFCCSLDRFVARFGAATTIDGKKLRKYPMQQSELA
ncbi:hypothetical protein BC831DRAFT_108104 [Entophlyctis helioformis]|nr:hypothetical protein BC831DRAFT_108104 [Entophlyctis helioformis]